MALRSLILDHFWLKLFSLILATLIWLTVRDSGVSSDATRTFVNRPILVLTDKSQHTAVTVNPSVASVTVRGPASFINELTEQEIQALGSYLQGVHDRADDQAASTKPAKKS